MEKRGLKKKKGRRNKNIEYKIKCFLKHLVLALHKLNQTRQFQASSTLESFADRGGMWFFFNDTFILAKSLVKIQLHSYRNDFADAAYLKQGKLYKVQYKKRFVCAGSIY